MQTVCNSRCASNFWLLWKIIWKWIWCRAGHIIYILFIYHIRDSTNIFTGENRRRETRSDKIVELIHILTKHWLCAGICSLYLVSTHYIKLVPIQCKYYANSHILDLTLKYIVCWFCWSLCAYMSVTLHLSSHFWSCVARIAMVSSFMNK